MIRVDDAPPVFTVYMDPTLTIDELDAHHRHWEAWYASHPQPFAWVMVLGFSGTPRHRRLVAEHSARTKEHFGKFCRGVALVASNNLVAGAVRAVFWLSPPNYPYKVTTDEAEARAWALAQMQAT